MRDTHTIAIRPLIAVTLLLALMLTSCARAQTLDPAGLDIQAELTAADDDGITNFWFTAGGPGDTAHIDIPGAATN